MSFLRPEFLYALPLIALPILIHLLNRRRFQRIDFGAMEFLRRALLRTRRRLLLEDLILLLLRTLAVAALILALARPAVNPGTLFAGRPAQAELLLLDASLSMEHRDAGASAFERAVAAAEERLADLDLSRGDRAALIWAGAPAQRLAYGDPLETRAALAEHDRPEYGRADWAGALQLARQSAESLASEGAENIHVTVLSDFQATGFDLEGSDGAALQSLAEGGFAFSLIDCGAPNRSNTAVIGLDVEPDELSPGAYGEMHAYFRHFGDAPRAGVRASLLLDGVAIANTELSFAAGEEQEWTHAIAPAEAGDRALEVRLDGDALAADDQRAAVLPVRPAPRVLLVGEAAPYGEAENVYDTLLRFLDLGEGAPLRLHTAVPARLDAAAMAAIDVALLADPGPLPGGATAALAEFHLGGGGLLLAAGPQTGAADGRAILEALQVSGVVWGDAVEGGASARLAIREPDHPALVLYRDPRWQPLLTEVPVSRYRALHLTAPAPDSELVVRAPLVFVSSSGESELASDGDVALLEWRGGGRSGALLAAPPLPGWNRLAEIPGGVLPLMIDLLAHLAPRANHPLEVEVGQPLEVELPRPPTEVSATDPSGLSTRLAGAAVLLPGGRARQPVVERAGVGGIWSVTAHTLDRDGEEHIEVARVAVVLPEQESDLAALDLERWRALLPDSEVQRAGEGGGRLRLDVDLAPRDYSSLLFTLLAALLVTETLLAALLDRRRG